MLTLSTIATAAALSLTAPVQAAPARSAPPANRALPDFRAVPEGGLPEAVHGVWLARGYGLLAELGPEPRLYDHSPAGTLLANFDAEELLADVRYALEDGGDVLRLTTLPGSSTIYTWDRLDALPEACATPPGSDPVSCFDYFWRVMDHHYAYFDLRGIDWEARRAEHRPRVSETTSDEELWAVLCDMLRGFDDAHLFLQGTVDGTEREFSETFCRELDPALAADRAARGWSGDPRQHRRWWASQYFERIKEVLLLGEYETGAQRQVLWGRLGWIGYINVSGMGGFAESEDLADEVPGVHALMSRILTELADTDGIILDVTFNTGGYDEVQMAIASHFVDEPRLAFTKRTLDLEGAEPQAFYLHPAEGTRYLGPVSLVTSDFTVSAGEDFTLGMRELPHVTHRGARTRGSFSDILEKRLPNGWLLGLSNEAYLDVDGNNLEGIGVTPDVRVPIFVTGNVVASHVEAIFAIADMMNAEAGD